MFSVLFKLPLFKGKSCQLFVFFEKYRILLVIILHGKTIEWSFIELEEKIMIVLEKLSSHFCSHLQYTTLKGLVKLCV